ncbi:MAG: ABC transporter permease [Geobacter sp.]|nr:MAG: ABC transporter permease [Geobacter sp.]
MFVRMLCDSLARRKSRKGLAVVAIWIGISLIVAFITLSVDIGDKMNQELRSFGANIKLEPISTSIPVRVGDHELQETQKSAYLEESDLYALKKIFWRHNIAGFVPRLWIDGKIDGREGKLLGVWIEKDVPVEGGEPVRTGARKVFGHWRIDGRWPTPGKGEVLVGKELATRTGLVLGKEVRLEVNGKSGKYQVSGILHTGDREEGAIVADLAAVQAIAGLAGKVSDADVSALTTPENKLAEKFKQDPKSLTPAEYERFLCTPFPGAVAAEIQKNIPNSAARVIRRVSETQGAVLTRINGLMMSLALLTFAVCCLSVTGVLSSSVLERRPEIALLRAIGSHRRNVLRLFLTEAGVLGFIGGALAGVSGSLLGVWLVRAVFNSQAELHLAPALIAPFFGILIGCVGSLLPIRQALAQDIARVLHGN